MRKRWAQFELEDHGDRRLTCHSDDLLEGSHQISYPHDQPSAKRPTESQSGPARGDIDEPLLEIKEFMIAPLAAEAAQGGENQSSTMTHRGEHRTGLETGRQTEREFIECAGGVGVTRHQRTNVKHQRR